MIAVLGGLADVERDLIRTAHRGGGRSRAQRRGQHMGGPPRLAAAQKVEARPATGGGRDPCRTGPQLRCQPEHDFSVDSMTQALTPCREQAASEPIAFGNRKAVRTVTPYCFVTDDRGARRALEETVSLLARLNAPQLRTTLTVCSAQHLREL